LAQLYCAWTTAVALALSKVLVAESVWVMAVLFATDPSSKEKTSMIAHAGFLLR
jgi:hypothetical protein